MTKWTLFSNHGHVLVVLSRDPDARLRDVAQIVGITERAVQKIVRDLQDGGLVSVTKVGRRNRYRLHPNQPLRHTLEARCTTGELLEMVNRRAPGFGTDEDMEAEPEVEPEFEPEFEPDLPAEPAPSPEASPSTDAEAPEPVAPSRAADRTRRPAPKPPPAPKPEPVDDGSQGNLF